jgi:hypothetical protein
MNSSQRINRVGSDLTRPHSLRHERSIKQTVVLYSPLLVGVALLMADLVLRDAGIAARFSVGAVRPFRFRRTAQAGTYKLLAGVAGHAACLRVAVLHPLLLRSNLGDGWCDLTTRGVLSAEAGAEARRTIGLLYLPKDGERGVRERGRHADGLKLCFGPNKSKAGGSDEQS